MAPVFVDKRGNKSHYRNFIDNFLLKMEKKNYLLYIWIKGEKKYRDHVTFLKKIRKIKTYF